MPRHALAVALRLANEMRREKGNVGTDDRFDKVKNGTYGLCEGTDESIGYARLKLRPWTRHSVTYKEELEREAKRSGTES